VSPYGIQILVPKGEGKDVMVSVEITLEQLQKQTKQEEAENTRIKKQQIADLGSAYKKDLPKNHFNKEFEYDEHTVLHFKEVVDCITVLFPQYDYLVPCDHSWGHDKQRKA